jgi:hypothetical protein
MTEKTTMEREGFTAETFARFWAKPDLSTPSDDLDDDVVGYWPGEDEPVRGRDEGVHGPIEQTGVDRIKVENGKVVENRIFFDRAQFEHKLGKSLDLI